MEKKTTHVIPIIIILIMCGLWMRGMISEVKELRISNQMMTNQFIDYKEETELLIRKLYNKIEEINKDRKEQERQQEEEIKIFEAQIKEVRMENQKIFEENQKLTENNQTLINENKQIKEERGIVYNIQLSPELQQFTFEQANKYNISYELVLAIMYTESKFNPNLIHHNTNGTYDSGLMQINSTNKKLIQSKLGFTDLLNAKNSIEAGSFYIGSIMERNPNANEHFILMAYNGGDGYAYNLNRRGVYSTNYSNKVLDIKQKILNGELT